MARPIVKAALGTTLVKRVLVSKFTISDITSADFDNPVGFNLVECAEAQAEDVESTGGTTAGTDVATVPLYSRLTGVRLNLIFQGGGGEQVRWALGKSPDGDLTAANFISNWHTSNDDSTAREVRKHLMAKGLSVVSSQGLVTYARVFVRRQNLKRQASFKEGDLLKMAFAKDAPGTTVSATLWGNLYFKANG